MRYPVKIGNHQPAHNNGQRHARLASAISTINMEYGVVAGDHKAYIMLALEQARRSPPSPTNFCVGALIVDEDTNVVLATGYTLELAGNTHAEQCCIEKLATAHGIGYEDLSTILPPRTVLYTTMEPCGKRLSGNMPCVDRIINLGDAIKTVYVGVKEPDKFVGQNVGRVKLESAGIKVILVEGMEQQILNVAQSGHITKQ